MGMVLKPPPPPPKAQPRGQQPAKGPKQPADPKAAEQDKELDRILAEPGHAPDVRAVVAGCVRCRAPGLGGKWGEMH